ncbi:MAG: hypothetical protein COU81_03920 [Candidatus Portnoybacteria bacterium CG10_big_fil_rev_8_21_14_0_10_36_7]|uniref:Nucleotide pyrophosphohydrolase n=1 Tax=Candidatus Portnoybacteria bacterium CG10_big_fil_rev_8_21_14_0_10_36_7 TaxID=1974812 RepID=A0A2M8KD36_9BACT|nr:MAG: hypothetical protein COU81_03920 [Candidatus Portnoybacteria bacterium CG10_big_fil_rev_8_21_14_0_10_36_7]
MEVEDLSKLARDIKIAYDELHREEDKEVWRAKDYAQGFIGDVGDLNKWILNYSKKPTKELHKKICHELADCMWSILVIAHELNINMEREFLINLEYLKQKYRESSKKH